MALLNMDDASSTPRVLPKVFADVPSTAELRAAEDAVARAKRSAGQLTILAVLIAGALIAVTAFLMVTLTSQSTAIQTAKDAATADATAAKAKQQEAEAKAVKLDRDIFDLKQTYAPVQRVGELDGKVAAEMTDIKTKLDLPAYVSAPSDIKFPEGWAAYKKFVWTAFDSSDWQTYVISNLDRRLTLLKELNSRIAKWSQAKTTSGPGKVCPDNQPKC